MLKWLWADLHIHTVLSACSEVEMTPPLIVRQALRLGLELIAITDHNACDNGGAVLEAAQGTGLHILPGMELQTREEVHLLCLFDTTDQCQKWQDEVWRALPVAPNKADLFGEQFVVDATGQLIRTEKRLLATSANIALEEAVDRVRALGGLVIPAHVDRLSFSLLANLGFVPDGLKADGLEVTSRFVPEAGFRQWPQLEEWPLIVGGDAHRLKEMRRGTRFRVAAPTVQELRLALRGEEGRRAVVDWSHT